MPINEAQLTSALKAARNATAKEPHAFAFVVKGEKGILLVSKKKVSAKEIDEARKELNTSTVVSGHCYAGEQKSLVFEATKPWASTASTLVKRMTRELAGITPEFQHRAKAEAEADESEDEETAAQTVPKAPPVPVTANTIVPILAKPLRIVLAEAIAWQKAAAALAHPKLKTALTRDTDYLVGLLTKGTLDGVHRTYATLEQKMSDAKLLPEIGAELARIAPVAKAHPDPKALETYATAKSLFDDGDLLSCRAIITQFSNRYRHATYGEQAAGADKAMADFVKKLGTLADGYEKAKSDLEAKIAKALGDTTKHANVVDEAKALKTFFAKTATLGLRKQIKDIETEADAAKRKQKVEKAIIALQTYLTAGDAQIKVKGLSIDYFRLLRFLHTELSKRHH